MCAAPGMCLSRFSCAAACFGPTGPSLRASGHVSETRFARSLLANPDAHGPELPRLTLYHDAEGQFFSTYGRQAGVVLIRPDGYIGWRGRRAISSRCSAVARMLARASVGFPDQANKFPDGLI
jgi:hypothetical protein